MARKLSEDEKRSLAAKVAALARHIGLPMNAVDPTDDVISSVQIAFPDLGTAQTKTRRGTRRGKHPTSKNSDRPKVGNWPRSSGWDVIGIAICEMALRRASAPIYRKFKEKNLIMPFHGSAELFDAVEKLDYWVFSKWLGLEAAAQKEIAVDKNVTPYVCWPPRSPVVYITTHSDMIASGRTKFANCCAIVGHFNITSDRDGNLRLKGKAYYLLNDGNLKLRGDWHAKYLGVNESEVLFDYEMKLLRHANSTSYSGLICLRHVEDDPIVSKTVVGDKVLTAYRTFCGEVRILDDGHSGEPATIYAEELRGADMTDEDFVTLIGAIHGEFKNANLLASPTQNAK